MKNSLFLMFLTIFNWFFEIQKWKSLTSSIIVISFKNSMEQSLGALTASLLTPNRIGEYGAKAVYYTKPFRKKIMLLNLIGNMMQMTTTMFFGLVGIVFFMNTYSIEFNYFKIIISVFILISILALIAYGLKKNRFKIKGFSLQKILDFIKKIPSNILAKAFAFSIIRYLIFSFQFYVLLKIFGVQLDYFQLMMIITTMYLLSSIVPSIFIFDVVIKGSFAVYLFSIVNINSLTILCVVTLMWLLNFVVPSVFGNFYVLNFNLPKDERTP